MTSKKTIFLFALLFSLPLLGLGCKGGDQKAKQAGEKPITIKFWGVWDEKDYWEDIFADYRKAHPNVAFEYRKFRIEEYQDALLEAWAEDRGPDIFMLHNTWTKQYLSKMSPLPEKITIPVQKVKGSIKKEVYWEFQQKITPTPTQIENGFAPVVAKDAIIDGKIYGLPIAIDTLALYYNEDILNAAGIISPPKTWTEFKEAVKKITKLTPDNQILQSAVAMGRADNVDRAVDILALLMMQNGAQMTDANGLPAFHRIPPGGDPTYNPGVEAVIFYTDFANPIKEVYTWNEKFSSSLEAFARGQTAMMFGYSYHLPLVKALAPKISFKITEFPQIDPLARKFNFANYWLQGVSAKSENIETAWDFILFATTNEEEASKYLSKTTKAPALRSLIEKEAEKPDASPFVKQAITATSWYRGYNSAIAEKLLRDMITAINNGETKIEKLVNQTAQRIIQTFNKPNYASQ